MDWKNILTRAGWTFLQGALSAVAVLPTVTDFEGWKVAGLAAISGGLAALLSLIKTIAVEKLA